MSKTNKTSQGGFTFLELIVCFGILMMVIVPVCKQFVAGLNQRYIANSINEATAYGEKMLQDVKTKITSDINMVRDIEGNKKKEDASVIKGTGNYLSSTDTKETVKLKEFFKGRTDDEIKTSYNTNKFSYEVGLWRADDINFSIKEFTLTTNTIDDATKLYTDDLYKFDSSDLTGMNLPINFDLVDDNYLGVNKAYPDVVDINRVSFEKIDSKNLSTSNKNDIKITSESSKIKVECTHVIKNSLGKQVGYTFDITSAGLSASEEAKSSVIELDVRKLMRKVDDSTDGLEYGLESRGITFEFINNTNVNQVIELKQNLAGTETIYENNDIFNIVVEDAQGGKSTILKKNDKFPRDNYIIGIIIREKKPVTGQNGKILKKMIDIYSYNMTLD